MQKNALIKKLHSQIRGSYLAKWDADADASCALALTTLAARFRPEELETGVHEYIRREQFWSPAKLEEYVRSQKRIEISSQPSSECADCGGTGWKKAADPRYVTRCGCWHKVKSA